jgi:hypothetical protein
MVLEHGFKDDGAMEFVQRAEMEVPVGSLRGDGNELFVSSRQSVGGSVLPGVFDHEQRFLREVVEANGVVACARGFDQRFLGLVGREVAMDMPAEYLDGLFGCQNHGGQGAAGTGWSCDEVAGRPTNGSCDLRIPELEDGQACVRTTVAAPRAVGGLRGVVRSGAARAQDRDVCRLTENANPLSKAGAEESFIEPVFKHAFEKFFRFGRNNHFPRNATGASVACVRGMLNPGHLSVERGFFEFRLAIVDKVADEGVDEG